ncbi:MAG TPA: hypothetical protein VIT91_14750 [Chthoniobacterales bacterium]
MRENITGKIAGRIARRTRPAAGLEKQPYEAANVDLDGAALP